mmetsp:Transcript_13381/g.19919  ORF Transcript_13381/g.19919 Transcript_13381/m.19919 type:complete len:90 (-) Transcript_13381:227-496(-)
MSFKILLLLHNGPTHFAVMVINCSNRCVNVCVQISQKRQSTAFSNLFQSLKVVTPSTKALSTPSFETICIGSLRSNEGNRERSRWVGWT